MNSKWLIRSLVLLATVSLGFFIYRYFFGYQTTENGLKYRFLKGKPLQTVLSSDNYCLLNYMIIGPGNDTIFNSYKADTLVEVPYPSEANNELTEALQMASAGSKLEVIIPTENGLKYRFLKGKPLQTVLSSDNYCLLNFMIS